MSMTRFSRFVRGFDLVPNVFLLPCEYVRALAAIVEKRKIDLIFPVHEDVLAIQRHRDLLPAHVVIAAPSYDELMRVQDKGEIVRIAAAAGVPAPRTEAPTDMREIGQLAKDFAYPAVVKTRRGNSGKGVFQVNSPSEAERCSLDVAKQFKLSGQQLPLLQEYVHGSVYGCCFIAKEGKVLASFAESYLRCKEDGFGTSVFREPCNWPLLHEYTARLAEVLRWTGIGHFDFVGCQDRNEASLIEMNPRLWGAIYLAVSNGYDFPAALVSLAAEGFVSSGAFVRCKKPLRSLWIAGELIVAMANVKKLRLAAALLSMARIPFPGRCCVYDDFRWSDPLPLLAELAHYGWGFVASGGDINPVMSEMMQ